MDLTEKVNRALHKANENSQDLSKNIEITKHAIIITVEIPTFSHDNQQFNIDYVGVFEKSSKHIRFHVDQYSSKARSDNKKVRYYTSRLYLKESGIADIFTDEVDDKFVDDFEDKNEYWSEIKERMYNKLIEVSQKEEKVEA